MLVNCVLIRNKYLAMSAVLCHTLHGAVGDAASTDRRVL